MHFWRSLALLGLAACGSGVLQVDDDKDGAPDGTVDSDDGVVAPDSDDPVVDTDAPDDSDGSGDTDPADSDTPTPTDVCAPDDGVIGDLTQTGPFSVTTSTGSRAFGDCDMGYTRFLPTGITGNEPYVILSHGFQRGPDQMLGWAAHWASWGLEVYVPSLCHATIVDTDHLTNGMELSQLATDLHGARPVVFAGHSAGGLASVVATDADPDAIGMLGLDMVDTDNLARRTAARISVPVWGLKGNDDTCNSSGNGKEVYRAASNSRFYRVVDGGHCDFENPTNILCSALCATPLFPAFDDALQRRVIASMSTGYLLWVTGLDLDGIRYWEPGCSQYDNWFQRGVVR